MTFSLQLELKMLIILLPMRSVLSDQPVIKVIILIKKHSGEHTEMMILTAFSVNAKFDMWFTC